MADTQKRLEQLRDKRAASERMGDGYKARIAAIDAEIAKLERNSGTA